MSLQSEILGLTIAYAALGVLLLIVLARTNLPVRAKAGAIVATSALYIVVFFKLQGLLGWSAYEAMPPKFELLWARVVESNIVNNEPGSIHLWVEELDEKNRPSQVPRAFVLPYSAALAQKVEAAKNELKLGHHLWGKPKDFGSGDGDDDPHGAEVRIGGGIGGDPPGGGLLDTKFLSGGGPSFEFLPLPPPTLPPKDDP
ncbi:hypothetical protein [Hyphomicrobium facile]|uniref:Uncharacterized protein n=1 Tax=Hyphomicrobium facile TaxID=51670 RepID=A0A1I7NTZ2_9HYPH|nr:hypothetical protein [Hyphomicrobium facile]SFV38131.1 hypothetical protein SAMN04488557_3534 [Hyphomicrobium facile]